MRHFASPAFWKLYEKLPSAVQELADMLIMTRCWNKIKNSERKSRSFAFSILLVHGVDDSGIKCHDELILSESRNGEATQDL